MLNEESLSPEEEKNLAYCDYNKLKDIFSTHSLLSSMGINLSESIYRNSSNDFLRWPFSASDFFETKNVLPAPSVSSENIPREIKLQIEKITAEIKSYKDSGDTISHQERIKELRQQKKELNALLPSEGKEEKAIFYKTFVQISDFKMVEKSLPQFKNTRWPYREQMPYFTAGLEDFANAVKNGEETAITGGPCFFGEHEVDMIFTLKDGSQKIYDFTTRRRSSSDKVSLEAEFTKENAGDVTDITFKSYKELLTTEEYDSILYLFELASATKSCLTLPIVDASYTKYLDAMLESLPQSLRDKAHERFRNVARPVINMYLNLFEFFKKKYPGVKCKIMTGEDEESLGIYYRKRTPFVEKPATRRIISGIQEKIESVKDYITLPALPYYFWGVKNILEVDYIGETDSFWKCRKMHKGEIKLSALLYPIKISRDGWRTEFSTERQYKEYIKEEDYGKR
ncbi:MAG: hypothetical protein K5873_01250 [Treponema sp.]|nr:hypothetical protein [Treponema sp.]